MFTPFIVYNFYFCCVCYTYFAYVRHYFTHFPLSIKDIFSYINKRFEVLHKNEPKKLIDVEYLKSHEAFTGELFLGHLRYGTFGGNKVENCHPFLRQNNWMTRNLVVAGNFNLTNVEELFDILVNIGQHPKAVSDAVTHQRMFIAREHDVFKLDVVVVSPGGMDR